MGAILAEEAGGLGYFSEHRKTLSLASRVLP